MKNNTRTNSLIKWCIIIGDFLMLNVLLVLMVYTPLNFIKGSDVEKRVFLLICLFPHFLVFLIIALCFFWLLQKLTIHILFLNY